MTAVAEYKVKIYRIRITNDPKNAVWYASKKGKEYYAILVSKVVSKGSIASFRLVEFEDEKMIVPMAMILHVHPNDCEIIKEIIYKSNYRIAELYK